MTLIGIEEHFLTTEVRDAWQAIELGAIVSSRSLCVTRCGAGEPFI